MKEAIFPFEEQLEKAAALEDQWKKANDGHGHCLTPSDFRFLFSYIHSLEKASQKMREALEEIAYGARTKVQSIENFELIAEAQKVLSSLFIK